MKAVGLYQYLPINESDALMDMALDMPQATGQDLLVEVKAISVNPVDTKVRAPKEQVEEIPRILGWDASGVVVAVGENTELFSVGDEVYYAGDITRQGSNSEFQLVDERIVGKKPASLSFAEAAALPLTTITAWEGLFDRLGISKQGADAGKTILIVGGAGGVCSIAIPLAAQLAKLNVIATASRQETREWCQKLGAARVINHRKPLHTELTEQGIDAVDYIFSLNSTDRHWPAIVEAIAPQGRICSIVEINNANIDLLKTKSATFVWEFMFTRSMYQTPDMIEQHTLLNEVTELIDKKVLETTLNTVISPINAENLRQAHATIEQGSAIGKIVLEGWNS